MTEVELEELKAKLVDFISEISKNAIKKCHSEMLADIDSTYAAICNLHTDLNSKNNFIFERLKQIESMITSHAQGVQNVYDQFIKVVDNSLTSEDYRKGYRAAIQVVLRMLKGKDSLSKKAAIIILEGSLQLQEAMEKENGIEGTKGNSSPPTS